MLPDHDDRTGRRVSGGTPGRIRSPGRTPQQVGQRQPHHTERSNLQESTAGEPIAKPRTVWGVDRQHVSSLANGNPPVPGGGSKTAPWRIQHGRDSPWFGPNRPNAINISAGADRFNSNRTEKGDQSGHANCVRLEQSRWSSANTFVGPWVFNFSEHELQSAMKSSAIPSWIQGEWKFAGEFPGAVGSGRNRGGPSE